MAPPFRGFVGAMYLSPGTWHLDAGAVLEGGIDSLALLDARMRGHAVGDPDVTTDHGVMADGDATQDRGVGINGNVILDNGVTRNIQHISIFIVTETLSTQGYTLIECYMIADDSGLTDDHTCTVINSELLTNLGAWMDVDTCL